VFDLLHLEGDDFRPLHLIERKVRLAAVLEGLDHPCLRPVDTFHVAGARLLSEACKIGLEGIVSKRRNAPYRSGVRSDWVKTLCRAEELFPIVGYTAGRRGVTELLLGLAGDNGELHYVGRVEHGLERLRSAALAFTRPQVVHTPRTWPRSSEIKEHKGVQCGQFARIDDREKAARRVANPVRSGKLAR
jgi:bifunctional non-homologous end joining protein LigD